MYEDSDREKKAVTRLNSGLPLSLALRAMFIRCLLKQLHKTIQCDDINRRII